MKLSSPDSRPTTTSLAPARTATPSDPTFYLPKVEPSRFLGALFRHGWIIAASGVALALLTWAVLSQVTKTYLSTGSVYVSAEAPQVLDIKAVAVVDSSDLENLHSVEQDMSSSTVLLRVIEKHELLGDSGFSNAETLQEVLEVLRKRVNVELVRGSRHIAIAVEDADPQRAKHLVESIVSEYENASREQQEDLTRQAGLGLAREEARLREQMELSEQALHDFRKTNAVPGLDGLGSTGVARDELSTLNAQLTRVKAERMQLEAEFEAFERFDASDPDALAGLGRSDHASEVLTLMRDRRDKEVDFERLKERYLEKHPVYIEAANELAAIEAALDKAVATAGEAVNKSYRVAVDNESKLLSEVERAKANAVDVEGVRAQFAALTREAVADRELHASVAKRLRETTLAASVPASILSWRDRPLVPERPYRPRKALLVPLAGLGGMFLGSLLVVGLELGDRRIRDTAGVSRATGVPLLARIPAMDDTSGMSLMAEPNSQAAEAFRSLRAMLMPPSAGDGLETVLFTSARTGEGKSLCAMNHAVSLAMQGHRTLLLDADMRRPGLSREHLAAGPKGRGLGDFLAAEADAAEACFRTPVPKLYLMSSGDLRENAAELLSGTRFPALLEDAYRWFDRVVIDAPAVLSASDAQAIARYADRTCLVAGEGGGDRRELRQTAELLRSTGANLVGFVWNEGGSRSASGPGPSVTVAREALPGERTTPAREANATIPFPVEREA